VILALLGVLVLALSVPAVGSQTQWFGLAKKASKTAKKANKKAKRADKRAKKAKRKGRQANRNAKQAGKTADGVRADLDGTAIASDGESGLVTSTAPVGSYESKGGPSVTVTVPSSGLIEVWAQVDVRDDEGGAVALYEDGTKVGGVSLPDACGDGAALIDMQGGGPGEFETFSTPPTLTFFGCANAGAPAPVLLSRPPGEHTYEMRYSECSCGGSAEFRNRVLRVGPRL
jgi:hypothetical protein